MAPPLNVVIGLVKSAAGPLSQPSRREEVPQRETPAAATRPIRPLRKRRSPGLASLPGEIIVRIATFFGPRVGRFRPRSTPRELFATCRALRAIGRQPSARASFLLANFGLREIGDGIGHFLRLVTVPVLEAVLRRCTGDRAIPRFQLQRLQRRLAVASRGDLLPPLLAYHETVYPSLPRGTRKSKDLPYGDIGAAVTDDELFQIIVLSNAVPQGCESLIAEGEAGGWAVGGDPVLTVLLTLQKKYRLPADHTIAAPSTLSRSLSETVVTSQAALTMLPAPRTDWPARRPAIDPVRDSYVPGTSAGHALLVSFADKGSLRGVKLLVALGVKIGFPQTWLFDVLDAAGFRSDGPAARAPQGHVQTTNAQQAVSYVLGSPSGASMRGPTSPASTQGIVRALCDRFGVLFPYPSDRTLDPVDAAVNAKSPDVLRAVLEAVDPGFWKAGEGYSSIKLLMEATKLDPVCHDILRSFGALNGCSTVQLMRAVMDGNQVLTRELLVGGERLSTAQLEIVLKTPGISNQTLSVLLQSSDLGLDGVCDLLKTLANSTFQLPGQVPHAAAFLRHHGAQLRTPEGRLALLEVFEVGCSAWKRAVRPYLGTVEMLGPRSFVAAWDMYEAVVEDDVETILELSSKGVRPPDLSDIFEEEAVDEDTLIALLRLPAREARTTPARLLEDCVRRSFGRAISLLLEQGTDVDEGVLQAAIDMFGAGGPGLATFSKLLDVAAEQANGGVVPREYLAARAKKIGGEWAARWAEYEEEVKRKWMERVSNA
ncbi:hypothetical protein DFJ74DRAFT_745600 [Hyaloraphidium curvatum]|nr:hypothetical protein DFJ74DRAFT_745600 [Hyaloraphidium curvatum]